MLRRRQRLALALLLLVVVVTLLHRPLLRAAGSFLVEENQAAEADAVVVLAGSVADRILEGVFLYKEGYAPRLIISRAPPSKAERQLDALGVHLPRGHDLKRSIAEQLGVPGSAIELTGGGSGSTLEEARALVAELRGSGVRRVIIVTSRYHSRRAGMIFRHVANGNPEIYVRGSRFDEFDPDSWWLDRIQTRRAVIEYLKMAVFLCVDRWRE